MGDNVRRANKLNQAGNGGVRVGSIGNVLIADVGKVSHFFRDGFTGINECDIPTRYLSVSHTRRGNLDQLIMVEGKARRFGVDYHNVFVELAERMLFGVLIQRMIAIANALRGVFKNVSVKP